MTKISIIYCASTRTNHRKRTRLTDRIDQMSEGARAVVLGATMGILLWLPVLIWIAGA